MELVPVKKRALTRAQFEDLAERAARRRMAGQHHQRQDPARLQERCS